MRRYLLFDAGCSICNQLARAIEEVAGGKLEAVSIRERRAMKWLDQVYPAGWEHQPYLVTVDGERVQAYAGPGMALRLGWLLGPRQGWRVWNLGRRYGVVLPPGGEYSAERRGFLKRAGLFVAGLFFFPRFGSAGGQGRSKGRPRHPLGTIRIKSSRELKGTEKAQAVQQALDSRDMRNVLAEAAAAPDTVKAIAVSHELEGDNSLLVVSFTTNQSFLAYYELARPIDHYATWAWLYVVEDGKTARLVSVSANGSSVAFSDRAGVTPDSHCGGCVFPYLDYDCNWCTDFDWLCYATCCDLNPLRCALCLYTCCNSWEHGCCPCGP